MAVDHPGRCASSERSAPTRRVVEITTHGQHATPAAWVGADDDEVPVEPDAAACVTEMVTGAVTKSERGHEIEEEALDDEELEAVHMPLEPWRPGQRPPVRRRPALLSPEELAAVDPILPRAFPDGMTLELIAACFGITRERVRQIEARALEKLSACPEAREAIEALRARGHGRPPAF